MPRPIHYIFDEQPAAKMWRTYAYLESEPVALTLLTKKYRELEGIDVEKQAYHNAVPFVYFIKQAREYFAMAKRAGLVVKPPLVYYGMMNLTKAYVLTRDPHYPSHTGLLRHGMSTRKRKKRDYRFRDDEVKVQKEGLLPHVLNLMGAINGLEEKYTINECLHQLPGLMGLLPQSTQKTRLHPLAVIRQPSENNPRSENIIIQVEERVLDTFHLGTNGFIALLNRHHTATSGTFTLEETLTTRERLALRWNDPHAGHSHILPDHFVNKLFLDDIHGHLFLRLTTERHLLLPEFIWHLLLTFHLSMLARYEAERWGEIVFTFMGNEQYLIGELLNLTERVFPNLLLNLILGEKIIFKQP